MKLALALVILMILAACQTAPPIDTEPEPEPDPLTVTIADYYSTNGNYTLVLENIIANRNATLRVTANCILDYSPAISAVIYYGNITVETQGSNRSLPWYGGAAGPGALSISCNIEGETPDREKVTIRLR